jgi:hypothetical protein
MITLSIAFVASRSSTPTFTSGQLGKGGVRTLLAFKANDKAFFIYGFYGFAKSQRDNIGNQELKALKRLAAEILAYSDQALKKALKAGELREVENDG